MKLTQFVSLFLFAVPSLAFVVGCQEPDYRIEAVSKGEGGVELRHVPKDPSEIAARHAPTTSAAVLQERIKELEAASQQQSAEIEKLKSQLNNKPDSK